MDNTYTRNTASFSKIDFFILSNLILDQATKTYVKHFESLYVPYDFITIFVDECVNLNKGNKNYLSEFLLCFNNNNIPFDIVADVFNKSKKPNYSSENIKRNKFFSGLKAGNYILTNRAGLKESLVYDYPTTQLQSAHDDLMKIFETIENNTKTKSIAYKYTYIKESQNGKKQNKPKAIKVPKQLPVKRVEKLVLPKVQTTAIYPKSQDLSRVDSRYFAYRFTNPADEVILMQKYHINSVVVSDGFISKRNAVMASGAKKDKFDDFF